MYKLSNFTEKVNGFFIKLISEFDNALIPWRNNLLSFHEYLGNIFRNGQIRKIGKLD